MSSSDSTSEMSYRTLGRTGETVSAIGLGGWHLGFSTLAEQSSIQIIRTAIDRGINFLDNSWDYNEGRSEIRMGKALRDGYREKVFLMTKIDGRNKVEANRQLEESLRRLETDFIDLVQHHEILRFEDPHRIFAEDGAHAALVEAQKAGKLRYIGFTGHKDPYVRRTGHEDIGQWSDPEIQHGVGHRMPALRARLARIGGDNRRGEHGKA